MSYVHANATGLRFVCAGLLNVLTVVRLLGLSMKLNRLRPRCRWLVRIDPGTTTALPLTRYCRTIRVLAMLRVCVTCLTMLLLVPRLVLCVTGEHVLIVTPRVP